MTLVLLHPLPLDGTVWSNELALLDTPVIRPTLYELGESIEEWASAVLDMAGDEPLAIVGNSVGGSCAIEMARMAPERVRVMVLVGAKPGHRREPQARDDALRLLSTEGIEGAWTRYWAPLFAPHTEPAVVDRARQVALRQSVDAVMRGVRVFHGRPDRSEFLRTLDKPVVVLSGAYDTAPGVNASIEIATTLRRGQFELVAGAGHYVPCERPIELTAIVRRALEAQYS
jgi:pimeloyl-[acyl-carrier protein] methyl ester esterase